MFTTKFTQKPNQMLDWSEKVKIKQDDFYLLCQLGKINEEKCKEDAIEKNDTRFNGFSYMVLVVCSFFKSDLKSEKEGDKNFEQKIQYYLNYQGEFKDRMKVSNGELLLFQDSGMAMDCFKSVKDIAKNAVSDS